MLKRKILLNLFYIGIIYDVYADDYENDDKSKLFVFVLFIAVLNIRTHIINLKYNVQCKAILPDCR